MQIFIGAGSNLGDRAASIDQAKVLLAKAGIVIVGSSPVYETPALTRLGAKMPDFLNAVLEVRTDLAPLELLDTLESVERTMGRQHKGDWAPRTIDLDLLLYGDMVLQSPRLILPHPGMADRWFVLKPLADLAPDVMHPLKKKTIKELLCNFLSIPPT